MRQHLNRLDDYSSEILIRKKQWWLTIWKKNNLLRLCCPFHDQNIQTFRSLHGLRYFNRLIPHMNCLLENNPSVKDIRELGFLDVCKEMTRAIDVIGVRPSDLVVKRSEGFPSNLGLMGMLLYIYLNSRSFIKIQTAVLRVLCKLLNRWLWIIKIFGVVRCHG